MTTLVAVLLTLSMAQSAVTGVVRDPSGGAVPGATVVVRTAGGSEQQTQTGPDGRFTIEGPSEGDATLIVRAGGFAEARQPLTYTGDIEVVLAPAAVRESVTVTPSRSAQRLGDTPASVNVLSAEQIRQSPAVIADDVLRQIPTFSLFRRTSAIAANPTAQGVSLRGIGPSGVSRTLVLLDNVPFNDPFGGWVYWTRVPLDNVERVEVVEGPTSSLYGNYAMGGVINVVSGRSLRRALELKPQFGNYGQRKADLFASDVWGKLSAAVNASLFDTDGFAVVDPAERGPVDTRAAVAFRNINVKSDYAPTNNVRAHVRGGYFREERDNGKMTTFTPVVDEANSTTWKSLSGGVRVVLPDQSALEATVFSDFVRFRSNFLAVPNPSTRAIGRLTLEQNVPTTNVGSMVQWSRAIGLKNFFSAGSDLRWVDGDSEEDAFDAVTGSNRTLRRVSGGTQRSLGVFLQDIFTPVQSVTITASARVDHWRNYDAHNFENTVANGAIGGPTANDQPSLPGRTDTVVSPRLAAIHHLTERVNVWGALSSGFRTPTLNELYRQFRVGALLTLANEGLGPERLWGAEAGVSAEIARNLTARVTWYDNRIRNPISNVTIGTNLQQRQNLGRTRVQGVQTDVEYRIGAAWRVAGAYLFNNARVREFEANPSLVDNCRGVAGEPCFLPQVPRHRGSLQVAYSNPRFATVAVQMQFVGLQYDDDQNVRGVPSNGCSVSVFSPCSNPGLPGYTTVDLTALRSINRNLEVFFGVQNLGNAVYYVQTYPTTMGTPRLINGGVRIRFSGR
ncbi:MAG: TonB-dependent receptor [Vicinamibacterales bacterium]